MTKAPLGGEKNANRHDSKLVKATDEVAAIAGEFGYTLHVLPRGEEAKALRKLFGDAAYELCPHYFRKTIQLLLING